MRTRTMSCETRFKSFHCIGLFISQWCQNKWLAYQNPEKSFEKSTTKIASKQNWTEQTISIITRFSIINNFKYGLVGIACTSWYEKSWNIFRNWKYTKFFNLKLSEMNWKLLMEVKKKFIIFFQSTHGLLAIYSFWWKFAHSKQFSRI